MILCSIKSVFEHFVGRNCDRKQRYHCIYIYIYTEVHLYSVCILNLYLDGIKVMSMENVFFFK